MPLLALSPFETVHRRGILYTVGKPAAHVFEHLAGWPIGCIRNGGFYSVDNLAHDRPILGAQVARWGLLDSELDLGADQSGARCKEYGGLIDCRLFHGGATTLGPDRG